MMYAGTGYSIELLSGKPWEAVVRDRILTPLGMTSTTFTIADMLKTAEPGVPFTERRDNDRAVSDSVLQRRDRRGAGGRDELEHRGHVASGSSR